MADTDVDGVIESLMQLLDIDYPSRISKSPLIRKKKDQIELLYKELTPLRAFLCYSEETRYTVTKVRDLVIRIIDEATKAEDTVDSFVSSLAVKNRKYFIFCQHPCLDFDNIIQDIQAIKRDMELANHKEEPSVLKSKAGSSSRVNRTTTVLKEDKIIGLDAETREIMEKLVSDRKKLDIISIVGMGGLGKTTLAKRVYNDCYSAYHFYIRGWVTVSQTFQKRDLLVSLCSSLSIVMPEDEEQSIAKLQEHIYKRLKGKRYLIIIDDIWSAEAWNDIRICFPDDNLGSRILVTSRLALHIKPDSLIHRLRFLTVEESWDLLQHKIFAAEEDDGTGIGTCPINLQKIGKQIAERCRGLPLAVLVISGVLANSEKSVVFWTQVLDSIGSYIASDPDQYMNTLSLSYNHLPRHLKSCFLYFGGFPEDFEFDVRNLMRLWIAEGFVKPGTESVAEEYLIDLIDRSLVLVDQKRSDGGVKVCRVHDLLHDLCLKKSKEENFLCEIKTTNIPVRRLFIHNNMKDYVSLKPFSPSTRSFLFFWPDLFFCDLKKKGVSFLYSAFKHIRVLALESATVPSLPTEIGRLVQLRYLSFGYRGRVIPKSISTLWNLQTLVVYSRTFPTNFQFCKDSSMTNLTHICIWPSVRLQIPVALPKLKTISMVRLPSGRHPVLEMTPNLKKLGCVVSQKRDGSFLFPTLDTLVHLEKLKVKFDLDCSHIAFKQPNFTFLIRLPHNLKKVTFSNCCLPWNYLSKLGRLPNLEILKIMSGLFQGPRWDTNDGEFKKLKYLKIRSSELAEWNMFSDHFPVLEKLVMDGCRRLKEIPMCLGEIPTLGLIELRRASSSAAESARQIIEEQQSLGNDWLKLVIYDRQQGFMRAFRSKYALPLFVYQSNSCRSKDSSDDSS